MTNILHHPDAFQKLALIGDVTLYEPAGDNPTSEVATKDRRVPYQSTSLAECITHVSTPTGHKPILKSMITTACERNCFYCPFRAGRGKTRRVTFRPDEMAGAFDKLQRAKMVDGIFLSSGIISGGVRTQDKILDTIEIIRRKYHYRGYVHLKIMPGSERDQLVRAMQLADRISINLEGPTAERLNALAPKKDFDSELLHMLLMAGQIKRQIDPGGIQNSTGRPASLVTQFVVGAVGDTDLELLTVSGRLYDQVGLARAYYSAFHPVVDTPFEDLTSTPALREHRLYQSSFLLRDYGWEVEDLPFSGEGNLRLEVDPKRAWADEHLREAPIDVMSAERQQLMRIPGIGPKGAETILKARKRSAITDIADLRAIGIRAPEQAAPYILLNGRRPPQQLQLL